MFSYNPVHTLPQVIYLSISKAAITMFPISSIIRKSKFQWLDNKTFSKNEGGGW